MQYLENIYVLQHSCWFVLHHRIVGGGGGGGGGGRTGLMVRASDSGSGDPGSILGRVSVLFP